MKRIKWKPTSLRAKGLKKVRKELPKGTRVFKDKRRQSRKSAREKFMTEYRDVCEGDF